MPPSAFDPTALDALQHALSPDRLQRNVVLAPFTTFRIGGPADLFVGSEQDPSAGEGTGVVLVGGNEIDQQIYTSYSKEH